MDDDAVKFGFVGCTNLFGIGADGVKADEEIACYAVSFALVKGDIVRVIVMLQILAVYL